MHKQPKEDFRCFHGDLYDAMEEKKVSYCRRCNICQRRFRSSSGRVLFCKNCRQESELYRFYDSFLYGATDAFVHNW